MVSGRQTATEDRRAAGELEKNPVWVKAMQRAMVFESTPAASTADAFHGQSKPSAEVSGTVFENAPKESKADFSHGHIVSPTAAAQALIEAACEFVEEDGLPSSVFENTPETSMASVSSTKPVVGASKSSLACRRGPILGTDEETTVFESQPVESFAAVSHGQYVGHTEAARHTIEAAAELAEE
mmetsp:Transcript_32801/g.59993  ORF Transcript_32801/g.59993 Transcript_32801/m.59993 type:complete len:184 (-) Transcript_32801:84-635(-)